MKKLNLGCGKDIRQGYINLDKKHLEGVDIVHDIEDLPFPFENEEFDEILCQDILEHVDYIKVIRELYRILKIDGLLKIRVPHFTAANNYRDPTHKHLFSFRTFEFFIKNNLYRTYYFDFYFSEIKKRHISFSRGSIWTRFVEYIVNLNDFMKEFYEISWLRIIPASNIYIEIIK